MLLGLNFISHEPFGGCNKSLEIYTEIGEEKDDKPFAKLIFFNYSINR